MATDIGCHREVRREQHRDQPGEENQPRLRVVERYSLDGNISRLMELYRRLIARAP